MIRFVAILLQFSAAISLSLAIAATIGLERGGWKQDRLLELPGRLEFLSDGSTARQGLIQLILVHRWNKPVAGPAENTGPILQAWMDRPFHFWFNGAGFQLHIWPQIGSSQSGQIEMYGRRIDVDLPFGGAIALSLLLPFFNWVLLPIRQRGIRSMRSAAVTAVERRSIKDSSCVHCGYDLRAQIAEQVCPECGAPVTDTFASRADFTDSRPGWLIRLAIGNALLMLARVGLAASFITLFQRNGGFVAEYVPAVCCIAITIVLYGAGIFQLSALEYRRDHSVFGKSARRLRRIAIISFACLAAGAAYQVGATMTAPRPFGLMGSVSVEWYWTPAIILLFGWIFYCCSVLGEFFYLSQLATRLGDDFLAQGCRFVGGCAAASGALMIYGVREIVVQWSEVGVFWWVIAVWLSSLLVAGLVNLDLAIRFLAWPPDKRQAVFAVTPLTLPNEQ